MGFGSTKILRTERFGFAKICLIILMCCVWLVFNVDLSFAQEKPDDMPKVKTLYVDYFGHGDKATSFKKHLENYLQEYGFYLTRNRYQADAVITGYYRNAGEQMRETVDRSPVNVRPGRSFAVQNSTDPGIKISIVAQKPHQDQTLWQFATRGFFTKRLAHKTAKKFSKAFY